MEISHREKFNDPRLKGFWNPWLGEYRTLSGFQYEDIIWTPDTFFRTSAEEKLMGASKVNKFVRVSAKGDVETNQRLKMSFRCPEVQKVENSPGEFSCTIELASCMKLSLDQYISFHQLKFISVFLDAHSYFKVVYHWQRIDPLRIGTEPLRINPDFSAGKINGRPVVLFDYQTSDCSMRTNKGKYSCLSFILKFKVQCTQQDIIEEKTAADDGLIEEDLIVCRN